MKFSQLINFSFLCCFFIAAGQKPPAFDAIKKSDLKADIFELSGDDMLGRRAGTINELRAAAWVAQKADEAGMEPAGKGGTYFQFFPLYRTRVSNNSQLVLNGKELKFWEDIYEVSPIPVRFEEDVMWLNPADTIENLNNKVVAMKLLPPKKLPQEGMSLWVYRYALSALRQQSAMLKRQGAKAAILVADSTAYSKIGFFGHGLEEGKYEIDKQDWQKEEDAIPVFLVTPEFEEQLKKNVKIKADVSIDKYSYPSANVVAKVAGTDSSLKDEYVLFSGHHDHDGVGEPVEGDSIWNGADDNASVSVAMLAIGRAWVKNPGKRSALFVWHGAEERGLFGSRYFVQHSTVPKEKIVAVLNGDMIGRNESGNAALLGAISPHRNSSDLVEMAMNANEELTHFNVDTSWDDEDHPEFWYFRSDHLPYAQANVPAIFFTTLLHPDYHTPKDEPEKIDLDKLLKMTQWMYATGWKISQNEKAPALDANNSSSDK